MGKEPVIIVDLLNCGSTLYGDLDWVCGGQFNEYVHNIQKFINAFSKAGIRLIFYVDGAVEGDKHQEMVDS